MGSPPRPQALHVQAQEKLCRGWLPRAERILRQRIGEPAVEFAGVALFQVVRSYDPSRGVPFTAYAHQQLYWIVRDEMRRAGEWFDQRQHRERQAAVPLMDEDLPPAAAQAAPGRELIYREELASLFQQIERLDDPLRLVALGKLMGTFGTTHLARMLGLGTNTVRDHLREVRESLHAA